MLRSELTSEWITRELDAVFLAYSNEEVQRALPLLLLMMAREFGLEKLEPKLRTETLRVLNYAGIKDEMTPEETQPRIAAYIASLNVSETMLRDIKRVFDAHYEALTESQAEKFGKMLPFQRSKTAQKVGEARPRDTINGEDLLRRETRMIRL
jgi:hypothetical protein